MVYDGEVLQSKLRWYRERFIQVYIRRCVHNAHTHTKHTQRCIHITHERKTLSLVLLSFSFMYNININRKKRRESVCHVPAPIYYHIALSNAKRQRRWWRRYYASLLLLLLLQYWIFYCVFIFIYLFSHEFCLFRPIWRRWSVMCPSFSFFICIRKECEGRPTETHYRCTVEATTTKLSKMSQLFRIVNVLVTRQHNMYGVRGVCQASGPSAKRKRSPKWISHFDSIPVGNRRINVFRNFTIKSIKRLSSNRPPSDQARDQEQDQDLERGFLFCLLLDAHNRCELFIWSHVSLSPSLALFPSLVFRVPFAMFRYISSTASNK